MMILLFLVLLCFHRATLQRTPIKQSPTKCTFAAAGNYEVMYYLLQAGNKKHLAYCTDFDNNLQGNACQLSRSHMYTTTPDANDLVMNMDFAVLDEEIFQNVEINMNLLGTPITYWIKGDRGTTNIEFHIYKSNVIATEENNCGFYHRGCRLHDNYCRRSNTCLSTSDPLSLDYLNIAFYVNRKNARYAYFFVKRNTNVMVYMIPFDQLLDGQTMHINQQTPEFLFLTWYSMPLIQNFPHENYQEHFFAFDPHYGCFALLYWDGNRAHFPEVHYYYFDEESFLEDQPSDNLISNQSFINVKFVDKIVLHGFDWFDIFDKTKGYHENIMTFPVFKSFGRQVYIGLQKTPGSDHHRYRIWSSNTPNLRGSDDCNFETTNSEYRGRRRTFVIDARLINTEKATGETTLPPPVAQAPAAVPPPPARITVPQPPSPAAPTPSAPITIPPQSSAAPRPSEPITVTPSIIEPITTPVTTEAPTENLSVSSTSASTTAKIIGPKDKPKVNGNDSLSNENGEESGSFFCGSIHNSLWGMLLFVIFDVILAVILIAIIVMAYIGKKKMKAAAEKSKSKKSGKKNKNRKGKAQKTKTANTTSVMATTGEMEKTVMATTGENMENNDDDENEKDTVSNQTTFQTVVEKVIPMKKKDKKKKKEKKEESSSKNASTKKDEKRKKDGGGASSKKKKKNKK